MSGLDARLQQAWAARHSIRARLTLWYLALLAGALLAFSTFLYLSLARGLQAEADTAQTIAVQRALAILEVEDNHLEHPVHPNDLPAGLVVTLYGPRGDHLFSNDDEGLLPPLSAAEVAAIRDGPWTFAPLPRSDGSDWRLTSAPVLEEGQPYGALHAAYAQPDVAATLGRLRLLMAIGVPATLALAAAGGLFLAGRALGPIDRITRAAQAVTADDLSRRLATPPVDDEVGRLARTFNDMLNRLDRAFRRQRQFTADASHELRTPLALLTNQADVLLARPHSLAEHRRALASMRQDMTRMSKLLGELLTLARADGGVDMFDRERLPLDLLAGDVALAMSPLAEERDVRVVAATDGPVSVEGDQTRLTHLAINLVDNAIKHTPAGGQVTVATGTENGWALLEVIDTGVGIAPEHLPYLFERFYRIDQARTRADGGAGLGLAICQSIATAHGGTIVAASQLGRGTRMSVRLPLAHSLPVSASEPTPMATTEADPAPAATMVDHG